MRLHFIPLDEALDCRSNLLNDAGPVQPAEEGILLDERGTIRLYLPVRRVDGRRDDFDEEVGRSRSRDGPVVHELPRSLLLWDKKCLLS